jgi:circadian clock protein KaiB
MTKQSKRSAVARLESRLEKQSKEKFILRLYIAGTTPRSTRAVANIKQICEHNLNGRYNLEVIDIYQKPALAKGEQIVAAPTLVKKLPLPLRRFIGDLSDTERIIVGMDIASSEPTS